MMQKGTEGYYSIHFKGVAGEGMGMVVLDTGVVSGSDIMGGTITGTYKYNVRTECFDLDLIMSVPAGAPLVMGVPPQANDFQFPIKTGIPKNFARGFPVKIETPLGPVEVMFTKVNDFAA